MSNVLESIVGILPAKAQPYAKTLAATGMAVLTILPTVTAVPDWVSVLFAVLSAPVVFAVPNLDPLARAQDESVQPPDLADPEQVILVHGDKPLPKDGDDCEPEGYGSGV